MNTKPKLKPPELMIDKIMMTEGHKSRLANKLGHWPFPSQVKAVESSNAPDISVVGDGLRFANPKTNKEVLLAGNIGGEKKTFNIRDPQSGVARFKLNDAAKIDETLGVTPEQIEEENKPEVKPKGKIYSDYDEIDEEVVKQIRQINPDITDSQIAIVYDLLLESMEDNSELNISDPYEIYDIMKTENMLKRK